MSAIPTQSSDNPVLFEIDERWKPVLAKYKEETKHDLLELPYAHPFLSLPSDDDKVVEQLEGLMSSFKGFRAKGKGVLAVLKPMVHLVHLLIDTAAEVTSTHMPGGKAILVAIGALLQATKGVSRMYDAVEEALKRIHSFLERVSIHLRPPAPPDSAVMIVLIDTFVQVFVVITVVTKHCRVTDGDASGFKKVINTIGLRANDFVRVLFDRTDVQDALAKLAKLATTELEVVVAHNNAMLRELHDDNVINNLRSWLCAPQITSARKMSPAGSCAWFFDDRFEEWMTRKGGVYFVHGIPGSGKSILWSSVVDKLKADPSLQVIHFYFDYSDAAKQDPSALISSLVFELGTHSASCLSYLKGERKAASDPPTNKRLLAMLSKLLALSGRTFLVIDALDECPEPARDKDLLSCLEYICGLSGNDLDLRVFVTSRPESDIRDCMFRLATFRLSLNDADKHNDELTTYVSTRLSSMRSFRQWSAERRAEVQSILVEKSNGMFLWVDLQFQILGHCSPNDFEVTLNALPSGLNGTYERILTNFPYESTAMVQRARHVFECIAYAQRPLSPAEVLDIFRVNLDLMGDVGFDSDSDLEVRDEDATAFILERCPSLLSVYVSESGHTTIQFIHLSVKEFLTSTASKSTASPASHYYINDDQANLTLARICLLARDINSSLPKFRQYANECWQYHLSSHNEVALAEHLRRFLCFESLSSEDDLYETTIHWAARLGLSRHMRWMLGDLQRDVLANAVSIHDILHLSALHYAAEQGYVEICHDLLEHGAPVDDTDWNGSTPLHIASAAGNLEICNLLLERGALVDRGDIGAGEFGWPPLYHAISKGHWDVARLLLAYTPADGPDHGAAAQDDTHNWSEMTLLHQAAAAGQLEICCLLLERGPLASDTDGEGRTPLLHAVFNGHLDVARHLLTYTVVAGSDVAAPLCCARDQSRETALHLAAALRLAAAQGTFEMCSLLLEYGAPVDATDNHGWTPLHFAARYGRLDIARVLLAFTAADDSHVVTPQYRVRDLHGCTALHVAAATEEFEICSLLLEYGALTVEDTQTDGWTPLHYAARTGNLDVASLLLAYTVADGSNVAAPLCCARNSSDGKTALHLAAAGGESEMCSLLLKHGAVVDDADAEGNTPLDLAVARERTLREPEFESLMRSCQDVIRLLSHHSSI